MEQEDLMLTHIKCHTIESEEAKVAEPGGVVAVGSGVPYYGRIILINVSCRLLI